MCIGADVDFPEHFSVMHLVRYSSDLNGVIVYGVSND